MSTTFWAKGLSTSTPRTYMLRVTANGGVARPLAASKTLDVRETITFKTPGNARAIVSTRTVKVKPKHPKRHR